MPWDAWVCRPRAFRCATPPGAEYDLCCGSAGPRLVPEMHEQLAKKRL